MAIGMDDSVIEMTRVLPIVWRHGWGCLGGGRGGLGGWRPCCQLAGRGDGKGGDMV